ncbi:phosphate ABC transporter substrate-binding protein PstS [Luethyella okanaganae]|uniref:Phosphate ABC transporter substrate-binding protein PstS n=1 Tax=Luethyella okanaganae TaxID=69372 RepID=A0ABW1VFF9_9MICO
MSRYRSIRAIVGLLGVVLIVFGALNIVAPKAEAVGARHDPISGIGSSWSANALDQWIRNVGNNYGWKIEYDSVGSSTGRARFRDSTPDFAVSEIPYELRDSDVQDPRPTRGFAYMPIVAGGTAFMYNLVVGGNQITNLRLSGESLTKIFTGVITTWNDPAIAADNPSLALPAIPVIPVVRSDGSGTTAQFTSWMRAQYPGLYSDYCARIGKANCGITSTFPFAPGSSFIAQASSNQVAGYVATAAYVGSITYVEYSYALNTGMPVAKVLNNGGYYTEPLAPAVAVSLLAARINQDSSSPDYLTQDLTGVYNNADPRSYPLSSYSYMIIPTAIEAGFTEEKGLTLGDFAQYFLCEGQQQADVLGYSPLPINLASAGLEQVKRVPGSNSNGKDISACNNPTFSPDGTNKLANDAPFPSECDKVGAIQCTVGTGGAQAATAPSAGAAAAAGTDPAIAAAAAAGGNAAVLDVNAKPITVTGVPVSIDPIDLLTSPNIVATVLGILLLGGLLVPPWWAKRQRSREHPKTLFETGPAPVPANAASPGDRVAKVRLPFTRRKREKSAPTTPRP